MNFSRPLRDDISKALNTFAALLAEWMEALPSTQRATLSSALKKGCSVAVEFEPLKKAIAVMLFEPGGRVQRLGLIEFVTADADRAH